MATCWYESRVSLERLHKRLPGLGHMAALYLEQSDPVMEGRIGSFVAAGLLKRIVGLLETTEVGIGVAVGEEVAEAGEGVLGVGRLAEGDVLVQVDAVALERRAAVQDGREATGRDAAAQGAVRRGEGAESCRVCSVIVQTPGSTAAP